jgi:hypothetical protein
MEKLAQTDLGGPLNVSVKNGPNAHVDVATFLVLVC